MEENQNKTEKIAVVVGAGDATGGAIARRFALGGFTVCIVRRKVIAAKPLEKSIENKGGKVKSYSCDARNENEVVELFEKIEKDVGPISVVVHNIGANTFIPILALTSDDYHRIWKTSCLTAFYTCREAARYMVPRGEGTIMVTGSTASIRGAAGFAAFSGAAQAKRALCQSMAKELSPLGVHITHVVVDGKIKGNFIESLLGKEEYSLAVKNDNLVDPDDLANVFWDVHNQSRTTWTFEVDVRPWTEKW